MKYSFIKNRNVILAFLFALFIAGFAFAQENSQSSDVSNISTDQTLNQNTNSNGLIDENSLTLGTDDAGTDAEGNIAVNQTNSVGRTIWVFIRMILVLAFVVFLIWLVFKYIKKANPTLGEKDKYLRKVAGISVGPGKTVQVVTLLDRAYLIGVAEDSINLIAEIDDKELIGAMNLDADMNEGASKPMNFQDLLNSVIPTKSNQSANSMGGEAGGAYDNSSASIIDMIGKQSKRIK